MSIAEIVAIVSQVRCYKNGNQLGSGSGFFHLNKSNQLFFITNRHVIIDEKENFFPTTAKLRLHTDPNNIQQNDDYSIDLYQNSNPVWLEHPRAGSKVDVVAIPIDGNEIREKFFVKALSEQNHIPSDVQIKIGEDVQVIGYPLGFQDEVNNLPIVRNATLASIYPVPFQGNPFVLIDSRLHSGTSGSPVMTKPNQMISKTDGSTAMMSRPITYLVGIHSASLDLVHRNPDEDEPLGLNVVWFSKLITDIINQNAG